MEAIPHRRRQLQEIQTAGLISPKMVRMIAIDASSDQRANTKWKCGVATTHVIATSLDDHGGVSSLLICQGWKISLKSALKNGDRVQSIALCDGAASVSLMTTQSTTVVACPREDQTQHNYIQTQALAMLSSQRFIRIFSAVLTCIHIPELNTDVTPKHFLSPSSFALLSVNHGTQSFRPIRLNLLQKEKEVIRAFASS